MRIGGKLGGIGQDRAAWLALVALLVGVLAPAAAVIWFMNEAVVNQNDAARQRVSEAYRGQLRLLRDRIDAAWQARTAALDAVSGPAPGAFRRVVEENLADAIVFFRPNGSAEYPSIPVARTTDPLAGRPEWRTAQALEHAGRPDAAASIYARVAAREHDRSLAARAAQAHVRSLVRSGDAAGALRLIDQYFSSGPLTAGRDRQGRLIRADAHLLALRLLEPENAQRPAAIDRLASLLDDYEHVTMPASQRLFLMDELASIAPSAPLPAHAAERIAAAFLHAGGTRASGHGLESTGADGIWKLRAGDTAVALFTTDTVVGAARAVLDGQGAGATFALAPPGAPGVNESVAAGPLLPGWQITFSLADADQMDEASRRRTATYLWAGSLAIAILTGAGLLLWQSFRRQMRITRLRTDLVAAVSHELKTPLASMRLLVDSLLDEGDFDRRKTRDYLQLIAGENARLSRLIEHFLTFSRIERNRQRFTLAELTPETIARAAVDLLRPRFDASRTDFSVEVEPGLPPLHGDEDALVTVLLNLLENAHTYTGDDKRIALRVFPDGARVAFEVEDNGIGIAPRDQKKVFRRFYQVDQRLSRDHGGCGLGLSIVDFIVRAHGGAVTLSSRPGVGTRVRVSLPSRAAGQGAAA